MAGKILPTLLMTAIFLALLALLALPQPVHSISWDARVNDWSIHREGENLSFHMDDLCTGNISEVQVSSYSGMTSGGYHSRYVDIKTNDVRLYQRTRALPGTISSEEHIDHLAEAIDPVTMATYKPAGSPISVRFSENWPISLTSERALVYEGRGINDIDLAENNLDCAGTSLLHSPTFYSTRSLDLASGALNITVLSGDKRVIDVGFYPIKSMGYSTRSYSSGLMRFRYRETGTDMRSALNEGDQVFYGDYQMNASLEMGQRYLELAKTYTELSCCPEEDGNPGVSGLAEAPRIQ